MSTSKFSPAVPSLLAAFKSLIYRERSPKVFKKLKEKFVFKIKKEEK